MLPTNISTTRSVELELIRHDVSFYLDVMSNLAHKQSIGVLIFGLVPYLSLFTVETYKYLQSVYPSYARTLSQKHRDIINASRTRTKLFDDTEKHVDGVLELLKWIMKFNEEWHINEHKGFLAPLKRALQDDLGIFFYDGHIIGSTHIGLFNMGYEEKHLPATSLEISKILPPLSYSIGEGLGSYLGQLSSFPEFKPSSFGVNFSYNIKDEKLKYRDQKAEKYFEAVFNSNKTVDLNFSLFLFLATLNFLRYIFNNIVMDSPITLFKLKFITLYHTASSLEKLKKYFYHKEHLSARSKAYFEKVLRDEDLEYLKRQKKFRNILVHYKIEEILENSLDSNLTLYGLVEHYFDGRTYDEIIRTLDEQIERISSILEEWIDWKAIPSQLSSWWTD